MQGAKTIYYCNSQQAKKPENCARNTTSTSIVDLVSRKSTAKLNGSSSTKLTSAHNHHVHGNWQNESYVKEANNNTNYYNGNVKMSSNSEPSSVAPAEKSSGVTLVNHRHSHTSVLDPSNISQDNSDSSITVKTAGSENGSPKSKSRTAGRNMETDAGNPDQMKLAKNLTDAHSVVVDDKLNKDIDLVIKENNNNNNTSSSSSELSPPVQFAHPIDEAPAKCNLVDSVRTLFLDVIVTNAVSPLNFSIQSYKEYGKLKILESHMTNWYTNNESSNQPLEFRNLILKGYYAVKYSCPPSNNNVNSPQKLKAQSDVKPIVDIEWRRCQIIKPFSQSLPILTYLVDHGCYFITETKNLQPLQRIYCELPCQSLEAKLHFVNTKKVQFTPEDCHRFHKQVEGKPFCSIIMKPLSLSNNNNHHTESKEEGSKINVVLIDTSSEKDHYVHHDYIVPKKN